MPLINPTRVLDNLIVLGIFLWIGFMIYNNMDKERVHSTIDRIKGILNKEEK